jgi:hypothetical protein
MMQILCAVIALWRGRQELIDNEAKSPASNAKAPSAPSLPNTGVHHHYQPTSLPKGTVS